jgi:hypothetical protein
MKISDRTHCKHGHEFTEYNTYYRTDGKRKNPCRRCKTCKNINQKSQRTHCPKGHEYTLENTLYLFKNKQRECKQCYSFCPKGHEYTFVNFTVRGDGRRRCRECTSNYSEKRYKELCESLSVDEKKLTDIRHNLKFFFSMTLDEYNERLLNQKYKCANRNCSEVYNPSQRLRVDHDHTCCQNYNGKLRKTCGKCIRGLLCNKCNMLLGLADDNIDYLLGCAEYLDLWNKSTPKYTSEETLTMKKLEERMGGHGLDVANTGLMGTEIYWDMNLEALPLDPTIFSSKKTNTY